jgi:hypothetical protein
MMAAKNASLLSLAVSTVALGILVPYYLYRRKKTQWLEIEEEKGVSA